MPTFRLRQHPPAMVMPLCGITPRGWCGEVSVGPLTERRTPRSVDAHLCAARPRSHAADATRGGTLLPSSTNRVVPDRVRADPSPHCGRDRDSRRFGRRTRRAGERLGRRVGCRASPEVGVGIALWHIQAATRHRGAVDLCSSAPSSMPQSGINVDYMFPGWRIVGINHGATGECTTDTTPLSRPPVRGAGRRRCPGGGPTRG